MAKLSHVDDSGAARMVNVSDKPVTHRTATARASVTMRDETLQLIREGKHAKGDVFAVARIAGITAAKRTPDMIPLCHSLGLDSVRVDLAPESDPARVEIEATVTTRASTGVEMEAMLAVSIAGLTLYDMCKAVDRSMQLSRVRLVHKAGGRSGDYHGE